MVTPFVSISTIRSLLQQHSNFNFPYMFSSQVMKSHLNVFTYPMSNEIFSYWLIVDTLSTLIMIASLSTSWVLLLEEKNQDSDFAVKIMMIQITMFYILM